MEMFNFLELKKKESLPAIAEDGRSFGFALSSFRLINIKPHVQDLQATGI